MTGDYKAKLVPLSGAEFYDCRGVETLTHTDPIEAVTEVLDFHHDPAQTAEAVIRSIGDITVKAHDCIAIDDAWFAKMTDRAVMDAADSFNSEFMPFDGDDVTPKVEKRRGEIEAALRRVFADIKPWNCYVVGEATLTPDDVLALVRDHAPELLEQTP